MLAFPNFRISKITVNCYSYQKLLNGKYNSNLWLPRHTNDITIVGVMLE